MLNDFSYVFENSFINKTYRFYLYTEVLYDDLINPMSTNIFYNVEYSIKDKFKENIEILNTYNIILTFERYVYIICATNCEDEVLEIRLKSNLYKLFVNNKI